MECSKIGVRMPEGQAINHGCGGVGGSPSFDVGRVGAANSRSVASKCASPSRRFEAYFPLVWLQERQGGPRRLRALECYQQVSVIVGLETRPGPETGGEQLYYWDSDCPVEHGV
jgi:hypothetical protein